MYLLKWVLKLFPGALFVFAALGASDAIGVGVGAEPFRQEIGPRL